MSITIKVNKKYKYVMEFDESPLNADPKYIEEKFNKAFEQDDKEVFEAYLKDLSKR